MSDAPFKSVHDALIYAFNFSDQQFSETTLAKLMRKAAENGGESSALGTGKGLRGVDGAGQAGMILAELVRSPVDHQAAITARYARRTKPCAHCGSDALTENWKAAIEGLAEFSLDHLKISVDIRLRRTLVQGYFGKKANYTNLAKRFEIDRHTVGGYYGVVAKSLKTLEFAAQDRLHWQLVSRGMIADAMAA